MKYLKEFIIGSSVVLFIPGFYFLLKFKDKVNFKYPYFEYTIYIPILAGLANVLSLIIKEYFGLSTRMRFLLITIITWFVIINIAKYYKLYNFTDDKKTMNEYRVKLLIPYFIFWNIVIYNLEKYI